MNLPALSIDRTRHLLGVIRDAVGAPHVLTDPMTTRGYTTDWTGRWSGEALAVVRPADTDEVSAVLAACYAAGVPVTPQGGNTGLVGGGVPAPGSILLSTRRLATIESVDGIGRIICAGAGVTAARADQAARAHGLRFGIDLASKESATLGGLVATNAGGIRMIRYGNTRSQLLGIEAVLADGSILRRWKPLTKDNIGYDIPGLLAGSEGTLAVITKVLMKLAPPAIDSQVLLAGVPTIDNALQLTARIAEQGLTIEAAEIMTADGVALVSADSGTSAPLARRSPLYALIEVSSASGTEAAVLDLLLASEDLFDDVVVERAPARKLWRIREIHTERIGDSSTSPVIKLDISVPLSAMGEFIDELTMRLRSDFPRVRPILFGHYADGNIHVNLLDTPPEIADLITGAVFEVVVHHNGSISAEHGIGRAKSNWITMGRTPVDIAAMDSIKTALDPTRILNPEVLLPI